MLFRLCLIALFALFLMSLTWFGIYSELLVPFYVLDERVRLWSYLTYSILMSSIPLCLGVIGIACHQLLYPQKSIEKYAEKYKGVSLKLVWLTIILSVLAIGPRYYLGYKVDNAGYVKCVNESRTSPKSSWRIYAKNEELCKSSSGIAGS
ncbi:DUF1240 domain-containing protein [Vibrio cholerae]|nr:DUF1240 domain-containing protein [Vibrio cholerae]